MKHVMSHDLPPELARKVAERAFASYQERYARFDPRIDWVGDRRASVAFSARGFTLRGTVELLPSAISFDFDVPLGLRLFKNQAIKKIESELSIWLAKAKRGEI